jgi:hypothetical protein
MEDFLTNSTVNPWPHRATSLLLMTVLLVAIIGPGMSAYSQTGAVRRVNAPFFSGTMDYNQAAIFWFGRVTSTENYTDVRVGYTSVNLYIRLDVSCFTIPPRQPPS